MKTKVYLCQIIFLLLMPQHEVQGTQIFHDWFRIFSDFVSGEPVTTVQIIKAQGYPAETHQVITEDGFILEMHRIPFGIRPKRPPPPIQQARAPVIVFHGNGQSSADWVINQPVDDALGFYLADSGYDVWLANQRGNDYSSRHVKYTTSDAQFWEYSGHEIGVFDLAAKIDYVLAKTGHPRVHFIGFSLSNSALMILLTKRPEYNKKVNVGVLLAPGGLYFNSFLKSIAKLVTPVAEILRLTRDGSPDIPPFITNLLHKFLPIICHEKVDLFGICVNVLYAIFGHDLGLITKSKMSLITSVAPSPSSMRTITHALQQARFDEFTEYDFGIAKNKHVYGTAKPPRYNLTNIITPLAFMVGPKDFHGTPNDAHRLAKSLPNVVDFYYVKYLFFRHLDFCYSRGSGELVYKNVVKYLDAFSPVITIE